MPWGTGCQCRCVTPTFDSDSVRLMEARQTLGVLRRDIVQAQETIREQARSLDRITAELTYYTKERRYANAD